YRCILLQRKECWKCAFQHTPTFSIEPFKIIVRKKKGMDIPLRQYFLAYAPFPLAYTCISIAKGVFFYGQF
ncbi:hypothetical protein, partial [[Clostridium] symbiosum]|uniref:hypothetical protein n=1 Tax=Clostridium symbiosum TaxID=1512 RepID=UPI00232B21E7